MSKEPTNGKDDLEEDVGDATDNNEIIVDEMGDTIKPEHRGIVKKMENEEAESNNVNTE